MSTINDFRVYASTKISLEFVKAFIVNSGSFTCSCNFSWFAFC